MSKNFNLYEPDLKEVLPRKNRKKKLNNNNMCKKKKSTDHGNVLVLNKTICCECYVNVLSLEHVNYIFY